MGLWSVKFLLSLHDENRSQGGWKRCEGGSGFIHISRLNGTFVRLNDTLSL